LSVKLPSALTVNVEEGDGAPSAFAPQFSQPSNTAPLAPNAAQSVDGAAETLQPLSSSAATLFTSTPALTPLTVPILFETADTHAIPAPGTFAAKCVESSGLLPALNSGAATGLTSIALVVEVPATTDSETALVLPSVRLF
jgi:hypothetical protein